MSNQAAQAIAARLAGTLDVLVAFDRISPLACGGSAIPEPTITADGAALPAHPIRVSAGMGKLMADLSPPGGFRGRIQATRDGYDLVAIAADWKPPATLH